MKRRLVRVGYRRTLVAADWDALTARQLLHLARLVQSGLPKEAMELAFGLGLLGRRIIRYQERDGEPGSHPLTLGAAGVDGCVRLAERPGPGRLRHR